MFTQLYKEVSIMKRILAIYFFVLLVLVSLCGCSKRPAVIGQDLGYWQERKENGELDLCPINVMCSSGATTLSSERRGKKTIRFYDVLMQLETEADRSMDTKSFFGDSLVSYTIELYDGNGFGLPENPYRTFTFVKDCEYAAYVEHGKLIGKIYRVKNPEVIRDFLEEMGIYIPSRIAERLIKDTQSFISENDSLMKMAENCERVFLRINSSEDGSYEERVPTREDDLSLNVNDFHMGVLPSGSMQMYGPADYCVKANHWRDDSILEMEFRYVLNGEGECELYEIIITYGD